MTISESTEPQGFGLLWIRQNYGHAQLWETAMRAMFCWLTVCCLAVATAYGEIRVEFAMDHDPEVTAPDPIMIFPENVLPLWLNALARPEAEMQRMAAETIVEAHAFDLPDIQTAIPALTKIVSAEASHSAARFAAARALIVLDAKDSAAVLFEASQRHGSDLRQLIEPALAKWKFEPARKVWLKRLTTPGTRQRDLILAIRSARELNDAACVEALLAIAHDPLRPVTARLEAARAVGALKDSGLEEEALRFRNKASAAILDRLCEVALLDRHRTDAAQTTLLQLAQDAEPSVAAAALVSLNANNPSLVVPIAEVAMRNDDANVRRQGVVAFVARPTPERVTVLARMLDDLHSGLRATVRESLFRLAQTAELDASIREGTSAVLASDSWRGQEQAALLLAALDHKPAAVRMVELLESPRDEVLISAAWGLRKIAVPESLPAILDKVLRLTEFRKKSEPLPSLDIQVGMLFEAMGLMKYAPAEELLRLYIPKDMTMGERSRSAAIWALGHLHAGQPDEDLAKLLFERLTDPSLFPPELDSVRNMSVVSMARMKTRTQAEPTQSFLFGKGPPETMNLKIRWALQEMTGEKFPDLKPAIVTRSGWFLEPIEVKSSDRK